MRYSFHGKMRFTGQSVDGFIDASNSSEAIDRLAEEGVIGIYTVNPAPLYDKAQLVIAGTPLPVAAAPAEPALVDKLTSLIAQVEKMLSRPMASGPIRGEGRAVRKVVSGVPDEQNAALKAIFQSNVELRKSVEKLAHAASLRPVAKPAHPVIQPPRTIGVSAQPAA